MHLKKKIQKTYRLVDEGKESDSLSTENKVIRGIPVIATQQVNNQNGTGAEKSNEPQMDRTHWQLTHKSHDTCVFGSILWKLFHFSKMCETVV